MKILEMLKRFFEKDKPDLEETNIKEQEEITRKKELETLGALTASIEHELRNPLAVLRVEIQRARRKFSSDDQVIESLDRIEEQSQRIHAAVNIVSIVRSVPDEVFEHNSEIINVRDLVNQCIKNLGRKTQNDRIDIKQNFSVPERIFVKGILPLLQQALINLLQNAVEATYKSRMAETTSSKKEWIKINVLRDLVQSDYIRIEVTDFGHGMTEEQASLIKEDFYKRTESRSQGGIGLFITSKIANLHKGKIEFQSTLDNGTTASLVLPEFKAKKSINKLQD